MSIAAPVHRSYAPGGYYDVGNPFYRPIDLAHVGDRLARVIRFNGAPGAIPVAQHEVLGAEAILAEGGTSLDAALFLHHDDHEFILGDEAKPVTAAKEAMIPGYSEGFAILRSGWDVALYRAAGLPSPDLWTPAQVALVKEMDTRMLVVELRALGGPALVAHYSAAARKTPRFNAALTPWPAEKAAEAWKAMHRKLTGRIIR